MTNLAAGASTTPMDLTRQGAVMAALSATIAVNAAANLIPINGQTTAEVSDRFPLLITPPGYVFGIWGVIYTGLLGYAVYQALPAQRNNARLRRIAWPFVVSCAANSLWLLCWHYNRFGLTMGAMLGLLLSLIVIDRRLGRADHLAAADRLLARLPFSIYLGWISVATIVNATVALYDLGWDGFGVPPEAWTAGLLGVGASLAAVMGLRERDVAFPLVLAWAFSGIANNTAEVPLVSQTAWGATAVAILSAVGGFIRRT